MKKNLHPEFYDVEARCIGCSTTFKTKSVQKDVRAELCSGCHPFYTGDQKFVDTAGRIEKFKLKYENKAKK